MSSISEALVERIEQMLAVAPLEEGEFRQLPNMGAHYVSLAPTHSGHEYFFAFPLNGTKIYVYKIRNMNTA